MPIPLLAPLLAPVIGWIFRTIVIKFVVLSAVFALMALFIPMLIDLIAPFISGGSLSSAMASIPSGVWFFIDFFALDVGLPLLISAHVARFLIRRLPVIG